MTDTPFDRAPGDNATQAQAKEGTQSGTGIYAIGLVLALILMMTSCWVWLVTVFYLMGVRP